MRRADDPEASIQPEKGTACRAAYAARRGRRWLKAGVGVSDQSSMSLSSSVKAGFLSAFFTLPPMRLCSDSGYLRLRCHTTLTSPLSRTQALMSGGDRRCGLRIGSTTRQRGGPLHQAAFPWSLTRGMSPLPPLSPLGPQDWRALGVAGAPPSAQASQFLSGQLTHLLGVPFMSL